MRLLRAIGIESIPELHELWSAFHRDHAGENRDKVIAQFISGGMMEWNFGESGSKQVVLHAGFFTDHQNKYMVPDPFRFFLREGWETTNLIHRSFEICASWPKSPNPPRSAPSPAKLPRIRGNQPDFC